MSDGAGVYGVLLDGLRLLWDIMEAAGWGRCAWARGRLARLIAFAEGGGYKLPARGLSVLEDGNLPLYASVILLEGSGYPLRELEGLLESSGQSAWVHIDEG